MKERKKWELVEGKGVERKERVWSPHSDF